MMPLKLRPTGLGSGIDKGARTTSEPPNVVSSEGKIIVCSLAWLCRTN